MRNLSLNRGMFSTCLAYAPLMLGSVGPLGGPIDRYASVCEEIAYVHHILGICSANVHSRNDANFRATFGSVFHRAVSSEDAQHVLDTPLSHPLIHLLYSLLSILIS